MTKDRLEELAILGGKPAFVEPLHVGRPNIGDRAGSCTRRRHTRPPLAHERWPVRQRIREPDRCTLGVRHCVAMCNGTVALEIAISCARPEGRSHRSLRSRSSPPRTRCSGRRSRRSSRRRSGNAQPRSAAGRADDHAAHDRHHRRARLGTACDVEALQKIAAAPALQLMFDASHGFGCTSGGPHDRQLR